ncbi:MAG: topoisomerase DNA-binding C4 zinc finger domain-containing protein [Algicola sp.]|nr:topoisomerase DNA-binding C4 zinc finger domain-containing protein [Algicola sp.]
MPENVTFARGGIEYIKSKMAILIEDHTVTSLVKQIEQTRLTPSLKTDRQHIKHVKEIISNKADETTHEKTCSKCGAAMVKRKATKGKNAGNSFWGCGAFPKCRNIENIA